jgi:hypothetical protein
MKIFTLFVIAISIMSTNVHAAASCAIKNFKNNQTRGADGTAYSPSSTPKSSDNVTSGAVTYRK